MNNQPYLSVVVTARNDDHGGNLLGRMQAFVNAWIGQAKRHGLSSELMVVDWNPPGDRPPLMDALKWPSDTGPCEVRFIEVPPDIHSRYQHAAALPLYQMIAKNVAIRRSRGQFILATNIDIIFSDELVRFLAERRLEPGRMYRMDRHDVMSDVPVDGSVDEQLDYCRTHLLRVCAREGYFELSSEGLRLLVENDIAARDSGISFGEGWYAIERPSQEQKFRWASNDAEVTVTPPSSPPPPLVFDMEPGPGVRREPFVLQVLDAMGSTVAETVISGRCKVRLQLPADASARHSFRFHVIGGGLSIPDDLRIMNFRVYHCEWAPSGEQSHRGGEYVLSAEPAEGAALPAQCTASLPNINGPAIPHDQRRPGSLARLRRFYRDSGGPLGTVRSAVVYQARRKYFAAEAAPGTDIFDSGGGIYPATGWHPLEHYRGETFRWAKKEAEIVVQTDSAPDSNLCVQIEPGPGVRFKAFELLVRDQAGAVVASAVVERLRYLKIPLPLRPQRTHVFSLEASGADSAVSSADDAALNFRLFWCGWGVKSTKSATSVGTREPVATVPVGTGFEWGKGWEAADANNGGEVFRPGRTGAEIIVQPPFSGIRSIVLDIEPAPGSVPFILQIRDHRDEILVSSTVMGRQTLRLGLPLRMQRTAVYQLHVEGRQQQESQFRVFRWGWSTMTPLSADDLKRANTPGRSDSPAILADPVFLHTNTCGDFTLMEREHWFDLRGYPEFDLYSFHIDSVLCYAAHHGGAPEVMLREPFRIYHIEHGLGSGWTPEGEAKLFGRLRERGLPWLEYSELVGWASQMRRLNCPVIFNRENWGLAGYDLPEKVLESVGAAAKL